MGQRGGPVDTLLFQAAPIEFGHDHIEQHLLLAERVDADFTLFITALGVPHREGGESFLMADQVDLIRVDDLEVGNLGIGDRYDGYDAENRRYARSPRSSAPCLRADNGFRSRRYPPARRVPPTDRS